MKRIKKGDFGTIKKKHVHNLEIESFQNWRGERIDKVKTIIINLKNKKVSQSLKSIKDDEVVHYQNNLLSYVVLVPIDKALNNIVLCKLFYVSRLLLEVGLIDNPNDTYDISGKSVT